MKLALYPKYKPSSVEWLGEVPEHWNVKRLKGVATYWVSNVDKMAIDDETPVRLCNYTDVYYHDQIRPEMGLMETTATPQEIRQFGLQVGDVLITKDSEDWSDIAVPALVVESAPDLVCGYHLAIVRPKEKELLCRFLLRTFQAGAVNQQFQVAATGVTRYGLPKSSIGEAWLTLPPRDEQHTIANFLDRETAKIDTLVAKKRTLIERLKEKRTALISRTVTRGLPSDTASQAGIDPHPKLKPSGIEWLGEVPEHWEVKRLKFILAAPLKYGANEAAELDDPDLPRYVRITDIDENDGLREETFKSLPSEVAAEYLLRRGDLLFARSGATSGKTFLYRTNWGACTYAGYLICARIDEEKAVPEFVRHFTASTCYWQWLSSAFIQATIQNVSAERYASLWVPLPPVREQVVIADFLDLETAKIDSMVAKIETAIERLQEYRTALITAAVTGKIDVREAAA